MDTKNRETKGRFMKNKSKSRSASVPKVDPYIDGLMAKLLERLVSLENKMDKVIAQTAGASSGNGHQPKPFQIPQAQPQQPQRRDRVLYEAICADCSKVCEVPFKPTEDRAVYCKECFARRKFGNRNKPGVPVLTPVAMPSKAFSKPQASQQAAQPARVISKKPSKSKPAKKTKKK